MNKKAGFKILGVIFITMIILSISFTLAGIKEDYKDKQKLEKIKSKEYIESIRYNDSIEISGKNVKYYDNENKRVKISNSKETLLDFELLTQYENRVNPNNKTIPVARWHINDFSDKADFPKEIVSYDIKKEYKEKQKDFIWKYLIEENITNCRNITQSSSTTFKNETKEICINNINEKWIEFEGWDELPSKEIEVGIFTEAIFGENIEFVFSIEGFDILEYASYLVDDIISHYKLDENIASTFIEDSLAINNGTASSNTNTLSAIGRVNKSINFDNTDYIDVGSIIAANDEKTISFWANGNTGSDEYGFISNRITDGGFTVALLDDNFYYAHTGKGAVQYNSVTFSTGQWYHVTITTGENSSNVKLYLNGSEVTPDINNIVKQIDDGGNILIGKSSTKLTDSKMDEVIIYGKAINSTQVGDLYQAGLDNLSYPFTEEDGADSVAPTLIANATNPATLYFNTDWNINLTATDETEGYIDSYVQFYNDTSKIEGEYIFNMTNNTNHLVATLGSGNFSGNDNLTAEIWLSDRTNNASKVNITATVISTTPVVSNIIWSTTGGFTDDTLAYNQVLDYINGTCIDSYSLAGCNITITDPDEIVVINNIAMSGSSNFTYATDLTLNKAGVWIINITGYNSEGNTDTTGDTITVSIQTQSTKDGWYGYANNSYLTATEITTLSNYGYDIFELEESISEIQNTFSELLTSINNSRNSNIKSGINIILDFNYSNTTIKTQYIADIIENFSSLNVVPYSDSIIYISLELENISSYSEATKDTIQNTFSQAIVDETDNEFIIYSKNYNSSGLDSSYIQYTEMLYFESSNEANYIQDQKIAFKNNASLNRIYTRIPDTVKTLAKDFHNRIIDNLRSVPTGTLTDVDASSLNNKDVIIFNNGSNSANFTINVSELSLSGKDVWDSTEGLYIEENTDQNFTLEVKGYNATILYFEDLDHVQMDSLNEGILFKGGYSSVKYANHTDANLDGNFGMAGAYDIQIELYDKHYEQANFLTYYGWLNASYISAPNGLNNYDVVILADKNNAELDALNYTSTEYYGYISVADYNNSEEWNTAKEIEVDNWLALNDSLNIFVDGMDAGTGGTNFSSRMKDLIDYVQITKERKGILNTYTAYDDFATWGNGGVMKESCVNRWNGISASTPDNYTREDWDLELERSEWFTTHGVDVYCQAFDNRSTDGTFTIENYTELQNIYFASKVLGYDYFYLSQPDFQYAHEEWVYDVGEKLGLNAQQLDSDSNTYYRAYENGIVYYNTTSGEGWIEDGLVVNNIQTCFYLYNPHAASPEWRFNINDRSPIGHAGEYSLSKDWAVGTWAWKCVDTSEETPINGRYLIEAWVGDHTTIVGQGYNLGWSDYTNSGKHSWYDTSTTDSFTAYPEDRNWMVNMSVNVSKKISIDTTSKISQTEINGTNLRNVTISSTESFPIEIWSKTTTFNDFQNVSFLNSTGNWVVLNYENNTNCDSNNPTWGTTTIESEIYKACIEQYGSNTLVRVATPSLSEKIFQITSNISEDTTPPTITIINPTEEDDEKMNPIDLIITTDETSTCQYSIDSGARESMGSGTSFENTSTLSNGEHTVIFFCNDTSDNQANKSVTFDVHLITGEGSGGSGATTDPEETTDETELIIVSTDATIFYDLEVSNDKWFNGEDNKIKAITTDINGNKTDVDSIIFKTIEDIELTQEIKRIGVGEYEAIFYFLEPVEYITINITAKQGFKEEVILKEIEVRNKTRVDKIIINSKNLISRFLEWASENTSKIQIVALIIVVLTVLAYTFSKK